MQFQISLISGALDTTGRYSYEEFVKAYMPMLHSMLFFHEANQVNGMVFFTDFGSASMSLFTWAGLDAFTNTAEYVNVSTVELQWLEH